MKGFLRKIPAILIMIALFILSAMPSNDPLLKAFHLNDKIEHFIAYFVLGLALCIWIPRKKWFKKPVVYGLIVIIICTIFGISDEYHQSFVPGRSGNDLGDMAADFAGGFVSVFAFFFAIKLAPMLIKILRRSPHKTASN